MARIAIPVSTIIRGGLTPPSQTDADATNDHYIASNDGRIFIEIVSSDASTQTVTVETPVTYDSLAVEDLEISIPAGATRLSGPFPMNSFNQSDQSIYLNPSVSTTLKFRAYKLP